MNKLDVVLLILAIWALPWKIYAVWLAAKREEKKWFVGLLLINTFAILEIFYIFKIVKKTWPEVKSDFRGAWASFKKK